MAQVRMGVDEANGHLPAVCMCCGQAATTTVTKKMQWLPPWVYFLIIPTLFIGGILIYAILASILTRRTVVQAPLCDEHKGHWFKRNLWMWGTFFLFGLAGLGAVILASSVDDPRLQNILGPIAGGVCSLGAIGWLVIVIACQVTAIRPKEITDTEVLLTGVSEQFVEAVAEADQEREERRASRRRERPSKWRGEDDEEEEARPRKKRPSDDRIEE